MHARISEKLTILYVCGYSANVVGGVQTVVPQYFENISKYAKVYVYSFKNCRYHTRGRYTQIDDKRELYQKLKSIDMVVFHEIYYLQYYPLAKKIVHCGIPYVVIPHGSLTEGAQMQKKVIKKVFYYLWVRNFIGNAKSIQFLSAGEKHSSVYSGKATCVIPNGVSRAKYYKQNWNVERIGIKLIFVGRLSIYYKGIDILLEACRLIKGEMHEKQIFLDIYGVDFENGRRFIEKKIEEYGLWYNVRLYGGIFDERKIDKLIQSDIFIQTSRFEGQPMGILEALGIGLPVIVTPGTTFGKEVELNKCGICVKAEPKDIAQGILRMEQEKDQLCVMSQNAIKLINENYLWDKVARRTVNLYAGLCKEH